MSRTFRGIAHQTPFSRDVLINTSITSQTTNWEIKEQESIAWLQTQTLYLQARSNSHHSRLK